MFDSYKADVTEGMLAREGGMGDGLRGKEGRLGQIESIPVLMRSHGESPAGKQHVILKNVVPAREQRGHRALNRRPSASQTRMAGACPDSRDRGSEVGL